MPVCCPIYVTHAEAILLDTKVYATLLSVTLGTFGCPLGRAKQPFWLLQIFEAAAPVTPLVQAVQLRLLRMLLLDPEHAQPQALLAQLQQ